MAMFPCSPHCRTAIGEDEDEGTYYVESCATRIQGAFSFERGVGCGRTIVGQMNDDRLRKRGTGETTHMKWCKCKCVTAKFFVA